MMSLACADRMMAATCRESYYEFFKEFWGTVSQDRLKLNWHIEKLCNELQLIAERVFLDKPKEYDLVWNCPPGTTKSLNASVLWNAWIWTRMPSARFGSGSYSERLALDLSRKARDCVTSDKYRRLFPEIELREDQNTKGFFMNTKGGQRYATGVGGTITGMHFHFIVVDDPIDPLGVMSDLVIKESNVWINETLADRCVEKQVTPFVLIMQRLHQMDPTGYWIETGKKFRHRCLPADSNYPIVPKEWSQYYANGLLDPIRLPQSVLDDKLTNGEAYYAGQYGQCLVPGTLILTKRGFVPIELVKNSDFVFTRDGFCEVKWSGPTKFTNKLVSVLFNNGSIVTSTPEHPIWTKENEFVPIANLRGGDYNSGFDRVLLGGHQWEGHDCQAQRLSSSMESFTRGVESLSTSGDVAATKVGSICTEKFGDIITETSPLVSTFITRTKTQTTIELRILNASLSRSISEGTLTDRKRIRDFLLESVHRSQLWKREGVGIGGTLNTKLMFACSANVNSSQDTTGRQNTAPLDARKKLAYPESSLAEFVCGVEKDLHQAIIEWSVVQKDVLNDDGVQVFDLTVDGAPEFYADGILVHNCPIPRGGLMFDISKLKYNTHAPDRWKRGPVRYWDKAISQKKGAAFTVGTKEALDFDDQVWILDIVRGRWNSAQREGIIVATARSDGKGVKIGMEQEPAASGVESVENSIKRLALAGFRAYADKVTGDKEARADTFSIQVNNGNVVLLNAAWNAEFVKEMQYFPNSRYKDQIDSASGAHAMIEKRRIRVGTL